MREYKFYAIHTDSCLNFRKFIKEVEERVNSDENRINESKKLNDNFAQKVKEIIEKNEDTAFVGIKIHNLERELPRYSYIKHLKYNDNEYEAEIDSLLRTIMIYKV